MTRGLTPTAKRLTAAADEADEALRKYRDRCKHRYVRKTPRSNDGNYDPSADRYWYDCKCPSCGKVWTEDQ